MSMATVRVQMEIALSEIVPQEIDRKDAKARVDEVVLARKLAPTDVAGQVVLLVQR
jgi:hypothetical protein